MPEKAAKPIKSRVAAYAGSLIPFLIGLGLLIAMRMYNYLLFHTFAELYSIIIAGTYFVIALHTRKVNQNPSLAALGLSYLFIALLDTFHTITYSGMNVIPGYEYPANQVWVLARFLEAISLLLFSFLQLKSDRALRVFSAVYGLYTVAGLASIFVFRIFPACFVAGVGQTSFKIAAEFVIVIVLALAAVVLYTRKHLYPVRVYAKLQLSIGLTILSEFSFTLYISNYDWVNVTGHVFKIISFYLVYRSILVTGLEQPHELLFDKLAASERQLRDVNKAQNTLLSILSHDIKGPIGSIGMAARDMASSDTRMSDSDRKDFLLAMASSSDATLSLVDKILAWARSSTGELAPGIMAIPVSSVFMEIERLTSETARTKNITLRVDPETDAVVQADLDMLETILRNFVQNAIKFTNPGGTVTMYAEADRTGWNLKVTDTGVGMSPEDLDRLFQLERRLRRSGTAGERGTGLGLAISHNFAERMGGHIDVHSTQGAGSTFSLWLPGTTTQRQPPAPQNP